MIKVLSAEQIRKADQYTIRHEPINSIDLMERAASAFVEQFEKDFPEKGIQKYIVCGNGNNGGDGLAMARLLLNKRHKVTVYVFLSANPSPDFMENLNRLQSKHKRSVQILESADVIDSFLKNSILIDAIFGTGLNQPVKKGTLYGNVIEKINQHTFKAVVSVDIPSGLFADEPTRSIVVSANKTYTFQFPKLSFLLPENGKYVKDFSVLDIKLHPQFIDTVKTSHYFLTKNDMQSKHRPREKFSHKGMFGHALLVAGSYGKMGAAVLAARACLRSGAGLLTTHIPSCGYEIFQSSFPEAMCSTDINEKLISEIPKGKYDVAGIGPGIGTDKRTASALETFLSSQILPIVVDADALNIFSKYPGLMKLVPKESILTPHPKEFERLAGKWKNDFERLELQKNFSKKHKVLVVLKGACTSVSDINGNIYFNSTGNPGMATGGSGDVLTGIILGLLAQKYAPLDSALLGVYLHGLAGDLALKDESMESLIASDIIAHLGKAFKSL